ncbi:hypothetical protein FZ942_01815 [Azospirillum lipoferum]|uniref:Uncharacterized protein n=1 Tax=Azospirillum lipoferum TaxID=193 RepID=A0A5A9GVZ8_AZOLI|nr:hypothetical protein FZ942_01815 [Azospirillum lipoferum]
MDSTAAGRSPRRRRSPPRCRPRPRRCRRCWRPRWPRRRRRHSRSAPRPAATGRRAGEGGAG